MDYYKCNKCGNVFAVVVAGTGKPVCCNQDMIKIIAGENEEASREKHVPAYTLSYLNALKPNTKAVHVQVGKTLHPQCEEHHIKWIAIETTKGFQIKYLKRDSAPVANFYISEHEEILAVCAYCNLHGLWKREGYI